MGKYLDLLKSAPARVASVVDHQSQAGEPPTRGGERRAVGSLIEATFRPTMELATPEPRKTATTNRCFPECPGCHKTRYWIGTSGKVICSSCGDVRFVMASIEYHPVN